MIHLKLNFDRLLNKKAEATDSNKMNQTQPSIPLNLQDYLNNQNQLNILLKSYFQQNSKLQPHYTQNFILEPRDQAVLIQNSNINYMEIDDGFYQEWIQKVVKTVCSTAFNSYMRGELTYEQTKVFCCENILKNIVLLSKTRKLQKKQFQIISRHLTEYVLPYMSKKYPLTASTEINKKLAAIVQEIDNISAVQNNFFTNSYIVFQYRESGIYNDLIMRVLNSVMESTNNLTDKNLTLYQEFEQFMSGMFELVEDINWMDSHQEQFSNSIKNLRLQHHSSLKNIVKEVNRAGSIRDQQIIKDKKERLKDKKVREVYKAKVKEYSSYSIGRKIPESVPLFSQEQIRDSKMILKHPSILRILIKWCQQLSEKLKNNFFTASSDGVKVSRGDFIHYLSSAEKQELDDYLNEEMPRIQAFLKDLEKFNFEIQSQLLNSQKQKESRDYEKVCGKLSYKIMNVFQTEIVQYLNKLIHSILKAAHKFYYNQRYRRYVELGWTSPPNLLSFKIGDLLRCKFSSKQKEILRIYKEILRIDRQQPDLVKIVRVKNRLRTITNDILINVKFKNFFLCQIQLAIKTDTTNFIKCSNNFHHYLYQLERSPLGPLFQICSVWTSLDGRAQIYKSLIQKQTQRQKEKCNHPVEDFQTLRTKFICSDCNSILLHNNYVLKHKQCTKCDYKWCANCLIQIYGFQNLKKTLFKNSKFKQNCASLVKRTDDFSSLKYGVSIFIESQKPILKYFKLVEYKQIFYLLNKKNDKAYQKITDVSRPQLLQKFRTQHIIISLQDSYNIIPFDDLDAIKEFVLPNLVLKQTYLKEKETINLSVKIDHQNAALDEETCKNILMQGNEQQRSKIKTITAYDNDLTTFPVSGRDFPNLRTLILSKNPLQSYENIDSFSELRQFIMQQNKLPDIPAQLLKLTKIKTLKIFRGLTSIPQSFQNFKNLKNLSLNFCSLGTESFRIICKCQKLEWLDLYCNGIKQVPLEIVNLKELSFLLLSDNSIVSLPDQIFSLQKLKTLKINGNYQLKQTPKSIKNSKIETLYIGQTLIPLAHTFECKTLTQLYAQQLRYPVTEIPDNISNCTQLASLNVTRIQIARISDQIAECSKLKIIFLCETKLSSLPKVFYKLAAIQQLNLSRNNLRRVEENMFKQMTRLRVLNLSYNELQELPELSQCTEIQTLDVSRNKISVIPQFVTSFVYLQKLDISFNPIRTLPQFLSENQNLHQFNCSQCPIEQVKCIGWLKNIIPQYNCLVSRKQFFYQKQLKLGYQKKNDIYQLQITAFKGQTEAGEEFLFQNLDEQLQKSRSIYEVIKEKMQINDFGVLQYKYNLTILKDKAFKIQQLQITEYQSDHRNSELLKRILAQFNVEHLLNIKYIPCIQLPSITQMKNSKCFKCYSQIQTPYYWLKWQQQTLFGCRKCVEQTIDYKQHHHHFAYKQNSILIPSFIDQKLIVSSKIGTNQQPSTITESNNHFFSCNNCNSWSKLGDVRYVCLDCMCAQLCQPRDGLVDLCQSCLNAYLGGDVQVGYRLQQKNHHPEHMWLRILYGTKSYYEY